MYVKASAAANVPSLSAGRRFYLPELDAMRFFAFLCVFFHHTLTLSVDHREGTQAALRMIVPQALKYAVSLFFLLSGYLITTLLELEKLETGRLDLGSFYIRRLARISPVYYCFLVGVALIGMLIPRVRPSSGALAAFMLLGGNWFLIRTHGLFSGGLGILWSINLEQQFYLVWPLFVRSLNRTSLAYAATSIIAIALGVLVLLGFLGEVGDVVLRFNPLVEMQFFAGGALLALFLPFHGPALSGAGRLLLGLGGVCCWISGTFFFDRAASCWWMPLALYGCVLAGCLALFIGFLGMPAKWIPRPVRWLGKVSYGLYVYHAMVLTLMPRLPSLRQYHLLFAAARILLELLITILLAGISYRWLERPFLRWNERNTPVPNRPV